MKILVINAGSSSIKFTLFESDDEKQLARWEGKVPDSGEVAKVLGLEGARPPTAAG